MLTLHLLTLRLLVLRVADCAIGGARPARSVEEALIQPGNGVPSKANCVDGFMMLASMMSTAMRAAMRAGPAGSTATTQVPMASTRFAKSKHSAFSRPCSRPEARLSQNQTTFHHHQIKRPFELRKEQAFTAWVD